MLSRRYAWENRSQAHGRTCVSTGRSPETSGPRRLNAPTQRWRPSRATPARTGCLRAGYSGRRASPMVVAHFFESGQRRRLRWASRERTANGRRSSAGQHRVHSCDRRKGLAGPRRLARASRVPHSVSRHCHETAREQSTRGARSSHPFGAGLDRAQLRPPGTGCSPANGTPEELRRLARPACYHSFTAPVLL